MPLFLIVEGWAAVSDPSPRKRGPSGTCEIWAASLTWQNCQEIDKESWVGILTVKGRTRIATLIDDAPSAAVMVMRSLEN